MRISFLIRCELSFGWGASATSSPLSYFAAAAAALTKVKKMKDENSRSFCWQNRTLNVRIVV